MKGSTDSAPNHTERGNIYLDCVNVKNSSVFSTTNTRQRSLYSPACIVMRFIIGGGGGGGNPAIKINDSLQFS